MTVKLAKYVSLAALAVVAVATTASCSREEDDIWDRSAAERLDDARNTDLATLCAATNGWEMLYFTANDNVSRGLNFLMKFNADGSVTIAAKNSDTGNDYTEETSTYDVISDDGPVLTFNTYNTLFHRYADPDPDKTQDTDGVGDGGDYEFKIMSINNDMIYMRGKKHGLEVYMHRLADDVDWEQYFTDVETMHDRMFNASIPTLWLTLADGSRYSITNAAGQEMSLLRESGDAVTETTKLSYVATRTGMRWIRSYSGHDNESATPAREFVFNAEGTYLVSTDFGGTAGATIKAPVLSALFTEQTPVWNIDTENIGGEIANKYQNMVEGFAAATNAGRPLNWRISGLSILYDAVNGFPALAISLHGSSSQGYIHCVRKPNGDNGMKIDFNDSSLDGLISTGSPSLNGRTFMQLVPELTEFCDYISTVDFTISLAGGSEVNPNRILFENASNANDYFYVELQ